MSSASDRDDFNDARPPYAFVRPNGRSGSCFANTYRSGAQFLLVLKKQDGEYSVNWYALGPVNEQLRSENDRWLIWVRQEARRGPLPDTQNGAAVRSSHVTVDLRSHIEDSPVVCRSIVDSTRPRVRPPGRWWLQRRKP